MNVARQVGTVNIFSCEADIQTDLVAALSPERMSTYLRAVLGDRIAHHEPIFARHLMEDHKRILDVTGWISPGTRVWIECYSRVLPLLAPSNYTTNFRSTITRVTDRTSGHPASCRGAETARRKRVHHLPDSSAYTWSGNL